MSDFEAALQRLSDNPGLLRLDPKLHEFLYFFRVNKHLLVGDIQPKAIFVLTVLHTNMEIPERLIELEPTLQLEKKCCIKNWLEQENVSNHGQNNKRQWE